jgi:hypothetical protein
LLGEYILRGIHRSIKWQGIGQESYEKKEPVVKLVPSDYIIQAATSLALYKEGSGEEFSYV